jgi:hypothetical protein
MLQKLISFGVQQKVQQKSLAENQTKKFGKKSS